MAELDPSLLRAPFTLDDVVFPPREIPNILLSQIDLTTNITDRIRMRLPLVSSPMDTVTEDAMAILVTKKGGLAVIHNGLSIEDQVEVVKLVRKFEAGFINDPIVLGKDATVGSIREATKEHGFSSFPITRDGTPRTDVIGIVTNRDVRDEEDPLKSVLQVMTPFRRMVYGRREDTLDRNDIRAANALLRQNHLDTLPILGPGRKIAALVTRRDLEKNEQYPSATKDDNQQLKVLAAVDSWPELAMSRIEKLAGTGISGIVIDARQIQASHIEIAQQTRDRYPHLDIILGNVITPEVLNNAMERAESSIDGFRIGIGTGEVCTTKEDTGIGGSMGDGLMKIMPAVIKWREKTGKHIGIIADGGFKSPKHIVAALMLGADAVMMGSALAGVFESPSMLEMDQQKGGMFKTVRGMGSAAAINRRAAINRYHLHGPDSVRWAEGIEKKIPYIGEGDKFLALLFAGVRQTMQGLNCANIEELRDKGFMTRDARASSKGLL